MRIVIFIFACLLGVSGVSAQSPVKVVHEYYNTVFKDFNASVVKVLHMEKDSVSEVAATHKYFSFKKGKNKLVVEYQLYEDGRVISVQLTGRSQDVMKVYTTLYEVKKNSRLSIIRNDQWVRVLPKEGKLIIQAIIY